MSQIDILVDALRQLHYMMPVEFIAWYKYKLTEEKE